MTSPRQLALEAVAEAARKAMQGSVDPVESPNATVIALHKANKLRRTLAALDALGPADGWRHKKRGTTYKVIGTAEVQAEDCILEGDLVIVYRADSDGKLWVRPTEEFYDGRFKPSAKPTPSQPAQEGDG